MSEAKEQKDESDLSALLCCPFDGGKAYYFLDNKWQDRHVVECEECGIQKRDEHSKDTAVRLWNERAT